MQPATCGGVLVEMRAERAPFLHVALVAVVALSSLAIHDVRESDDAAVAERKAEAAAAQAVKDIQAAKDELDKLMRELDELDDQIARAVNASAEAKNDADRAAAEARLRQLKEQYEEMKQRAMLSRALADRGKDVKCVCIPRRCMDHPQAKSCL